MDMNKQQQQQLKTTTMDKEPSTLLAYEQALSSAWNDAPAVTIDYRDLSYVHTIPRAVNDTVTWPVVIMRSALRLFRGAPPTRTLTALHNTTGTVRPGTMTLILSPPGHGKSTLLKALAGRYSLHNDPNLRGTIRYNGLTFDEARAAGLHVNKLTAYVDQADAHLSLLTVRETFQFALDNAVADPALLRNPDVQRLHARRVDDMLAMLGLKECAETVIGNHMVRGVSGGQKRRVSLGEMMLTNARALFLDEITTGLDSSTSFDILSLLRRWTRQTSSSCVATLLQPTPECFALFDRLILMRQGHVVYDGATSHAQAYIESLGVPVPTDMDFADFLTDYLADPKAVFLRGLYRRMRQAEISQTRSLAAHATATTTTNDISIADAAASAGAASAPSSPTAKLPVGMRSTKLTHVPLTTAALVDAFHTSSCFIDQMSGDVAPASASASSPPAAPPARSATTPSAYSRAQLYRSSPHSFAHHLALNLRRQFTFMRRNAGFFRPRIIQAVVNGLIYGSLFWQLNPNDYSSHYGLVVFMLLAMGLLNSGELPVSAEAKQVIFKQLDTGFYSVTPYIISVALVHLLLAVSETMIMGTITYWMSGFTPEPARWIFFVFVLVLSNTCMAMIFRMWSYITWRPEVAQQISMPINGVSMIFCGYMTTAGKIPAWLSWVYWSVPYSWAFRSLAQNEFLDNPSRYPDTRYLEAYDVRTDGDYKWAGVGYLIGLNIVFAALSAWALAVRRFALTMGTRRSLVDEEQEEAENAQPAKQIAIGASVDPDALRTYGSSYRARASASSTLPFTPVDLVWRNITYTVQVKATTLPRAKANASNRKANANATVDRVLLHDVNGFARAGTLTALMGSSGAGKTTLLDVLAFRKTTGKVDGDILVNGSPASAATFKRITGYVEQTDLHLGTQTVREAMLFSARLRLPRDVPDDRVSEFVDEILTLLELAPLANRLIGDDSMPSLSPAQLKCVTIGVELVANPPILFLDEPTSGLDSRAALVVMRVIKRIATTGRAVLCTIHQPSSELFYMFDRLLLLKSGGREVFFGDLGEFGAGLVEYFESAPVSDPAAAPKLPPRTNPASWMLEVIGAGTGAKKPAVGDAVVVVPAAAESVAVAPVAKETVALQTESAPVAPTEPAAAPAQSSTATLTPVSGVEMVSVTLSNTASAPASASPDTGSANALTSVQIETPATAVPTAVAAPAAVAAAVASTAHAVTPLPDFAQVYRESKLRHENMETLETLSKVRPGVAPFSLGSRYAASFTTQYWLVQCRAFQYYARNAPFVIMRFFTIFTMSFLFGLLCLQIGEADQAALMSKIAVIYLSIAFQAFLLTASAMPVLFRFRAISYRERSSFIYSSPAYAIAMILVEVVYILIIATAFLLPFYFLVGFQTDAALFFKYYFALVLVLLCFDMWAQVLVAALPNIVVANIANGSVGLLAFLLSGVFLRAPFIPVGWKWVYYINWLSKAFLAIAVSQFECKDPASSDSPNCRQISVIADGSGGVVQQRVSDYVRAYFGAGPDMYWPYVGWLILTLAVFVALVVLAASKVNHMKR